MRATILESSFSLSVCTLDASSKPLIPLDRAAHTARSGHVLRRRGAAMLPQRQPQPIRKASIELDGETRAYSFQLRMATRIATKLCPFLRQASKWNCNNPEE
jgi:hypothetical protein